MSTSIKKKFLTTIIIGFVVGIISSIITFFWFIVEIIKLNVIDNHEFAFASI